MNTKLGKVQVYQWEVAILKPIWPFDTVTHVGSVDNLKKLYSHYQQIYGQ